MARVFVAMSGGVDSSTAAALLVESGHDVTGVTMRLLAGDGPDGCCSADGSRAARRVCDAIGIPHYSLEMAAEFERHVITPYVDEYAAGRTPNPCIACNDRVKFDELMRRVMLQGADYLATGHYARVVEAQGTRWLARGVDETKDQSYFLYRMTPSQLAHTLFPLGGLRKSEVRDIARAHGLPTAERPESQESCFVADGDVRAYLRSQRPEIFVPGDVVDGSGATVGAHDGVAGLTIGQRRGLGIGTREPLYVTRIDAVRAVVTVGPRTDAAACRLTASSAVWHGSAEDVRVTARVRYRGPEVAAVARSSGSRLSVVFDEAMDAPAPGQALVCYLEDRVLGGGVVEEAS
jgi:tRNA-specific 2-thiouridylase